MSFRVGLPLVTAGVAMIMDLRTARVENGWLLFMLAVRMAAGFYTNGLAFLSSFFTGLAFPFLVLIWLYIFRLLGPGDIKLFCVLGSMLGPDHIGHLMLAALFSGGVLSVLLLVSLGGFRERFRYLLSYLTDYLQTRERKPYYKPGMQIENIHFTVPIFLGTLLCVGGVL